MQRFLEGQHLGFPGSEWPKPEEYSIATLASLAVHITVVDPGFWKGEGASVRLLIAPAHLNDSVGGRFFTEPEIDDRAEPLAELGSW